MTAPNRSTGVNWRASRDSIAGFRFGVVAISLTRSAEPFTSAKKDTAKTTTMAPAAQRIGPSAATTIQPDLVLGTTPV